MEQEKCEVCGRRIKKGEFHKRPYACVGNLIKEIEELDEKVKNLEETLDKRHDIIRKMKAFLVERGLWDDFLEAYEDDELIQMMKEPEEGD